MADELISISRDTEDEFLAVGVNLQSFSNGCIENSSSASSIVTMMEDGSGLNINAFKELFEHAHNKVESCAAAISQGIRGMTG
ncbi:MAG: hypothetical protein HY099_02955, partial [Nitrospirae bacterium]|nr:hypothetical protein [Nitrospirota bacterium]